MIVKIKPLNKRAKNRVNEHGELYQFVKNGAYNGVTAILVRSLVDNACIPWSGWFDINEAEWTIKYD